MNELRWGLFSKRELILIFFRHRLDVKFAGRRYLRAATGGHFSSLPPENRGLVIRIRETPVPIPQQALCQGGVSGYEDRAGLLKAPSPLVAQGVGVCELPQDCVPIQVRASVDINLLIREASPNKVPAPVVESEKVPVIVVSFEIVCGAHWESAELG